MAFENKRPKVIVFDWGDTLMQVNPAYTNAMVDWPEVAEVPGAAEMLAALRGRYRLVLASNAADSSPGQIRTALDRVSLGQYIEEIFTMVRVQARKPELAFFRGVEQACGARPEEMLMVGDRFEDDVLGAWRAGWMTAWYNPTGRAAPGLLPLHSIELRDLRELPEKINGRRLPEVRDCLTWYLQVGTPRRLLDHVEKVAQVSYLMALWLRNAGHPADPILAHRGGLLHDLAKLQADETKGESHAERAGQMLEERGQPELARIARRHLLFSLLREEDRPITWEEKVVCFADKLVEGSQLVSFEECLAALQARYRHLGSLEPERLERLRSALNEAQNELCAAMGFAPEELLPRLR